MTDLHAVMRAFGFTYSEAESLPLGDLVILIALMEDEK